MNKTNKKLLIVNIGLALVLLAGLFTACTSNGKTQALLVQTQQLANEVSSLKATVAQLQAQVEENKSSFAYLNELVNLVIKVANLPIATK